MPINSISRSGPVFSSSGITYSPAPDYNAVEYGQAALKLGHEGPAVVKLQKELERLGFDLEPDGKFGPKTLAAVQRFQSMHGLSPDGIAGTQTVGAFESSFTPARKRPMPPLTPIDTPVPDSGPAGRFEQEALQKHGQAFVDRAKQVAARIGCRPERLFAVMHNESGMRPDAVNPHGGATGLIQFMPATARGLGTTTEALKNMSATQQLDFVERYFAPFAGRIHSGADLYLATFYPAAMGKSDDWVLGSQNGTAHTVARYNPIFDLDRDGQISAGEFRRYYNNRFPELAS